MDVNNDTNVSEYEEEIQKPSATYANGRPVDIPEDINERDVAIKEWSEGNEHLENALRECIENAIKTEASCAGHKGMNCDPYLAIEITDDARGNIYNILNTLFKNKKCFSSIDLFNDTYDNVNPKSHIAIHAKYKTRNEMFDLIAEAAKEKTELESCHPIVQKMMDIENKAKSLETYSHVVTYHKLGPIKALILPNNTINMNRYIYDKTNIKNTVNLCLTDSQVVEKLSSICDGMGALMVPPKSIFKKTNTWELTEEEKSKVNEYKPEPNLEGNKAEEKSSEEITI